MRCHVFFFFFQAEDGIRDLTVTGVQTCALPISTAKRRALDDLRRRNLLARKHEILIRDLEQEQQAMPDPDAALDDDIGDRSEERRVGKECRSRWSPYH